MVTNVARATPAVSAEAKYAAWDTARPTPPTIAVDHCTRREVVDRCAADERDVGDERDVVDERDRADDRHLAARTTASAATATTKRQNDTVTGPRLLCLCRITATAPPVPQAIDAAAIDSTPRTCVGAGRTAEGTSKLMRLQTRADA
jgi:hypothetical protein